MTVSSAQTYQKAAVFGTICAFKMAREVTILIPPSCLSSPISRCGTGIERTAINRL